jgi:hypothetical protein
MFGPADIWAVRRNVRDDGGANAPAIATIAAEAQQSWVIDRVDYSYDGAPDVAVFPSLTIRYDAVPVAIAVFDVDVTQAGRGCVRFPRGLAVLDANGEPIRNRGVTVNLSRGGAGVSSEVNVFFR